MTRARYWFDSGLVLGMGALVVGVLATEWWSAIPGWLSLAWYAGATWRDRPKTERRRPPN